jgi:hypothetical protein
LKYIKKKFNQEKRATECPASENQSGCRRCGDFIMAPAVAKISG